MSRYTVQRHPCLRLVAVMDRDTGVSKAPYQVDADEALAMQAAVRYCQYLCELDRQRAVSP